MEVIFSVESDFDLPIWIERVPSQSNPADILSREVVMFLGDAKGVEVDPREMWCLLAEVASNVETEKARLWEVSQPFPH